MRSFSRITVAATALLCASYFAWSWHRLTVKVIVMDPSWPRPWPYPDGWLSAVERWFDARNPAGPNAIKIHGEFDRVRVLILSALATSLHVLAVATVRFLRRTRPSPAAQARPPLGGGVAHSDVPAPADHRKPAHEPSVTKGGRGAWRTRSSSPSQSPQAFPQALPPFSRGGGGGPAHRCSRRPVSARPRSESRNSPS